MIFTNNSLFTIQTTQITKKIVFLSSILVEITKLPYALSSNILWELYT